MNSGLYRPPRQRLGSPSISSPQPNPPPPTRMTTRRQHGSVKLNLKYKSHALSATTVSISLSRNPVSALHDQNWKNAMQDEYNALIDSKTLELVPCPTNENIIRSLWICWHKINMMVLLREA